MVVPTVLAITARRRAGLVVDSAADPDAAELAMFASQDFIEISNLFDDLVNPARAERPSTCAERRPGGINGPTGDGARHARCPDVRLGSCPAAVVVSRPAGAGGW
jgi:hypothetical protein